MVDIVEASEQAVPFFARVWSWPMDRSAVFGATKSPEFKWLSNMARVTMALGAWTASSSEALYQAAKFPDDAGLQQAVLTASPRESKSLAAAHSADIVADWMMRRRRAMLVVLRLKLSESAATADTLRATGDRPIVEVSRRDDFWGAVEVRGELRGTNMLGRMWMFLRQGDAAELEVWALAQQDALWPLSGTRSDRHG